ncbi:MAG: O-antigen ligase family protein [Burkholderiales bacterium]|nr:O-antigen ligase family protein [Burkholderiales bacterium]
MNTNPPAPVTLRTLPWVLLAVAAFVFLAPNIDFAADLRWHDSQRFAQLALLAVVVFSLAWPGAARSLADTWALLPCWGRIALQGAFVLGFASGLLAPLPRWALLEWGQLWLLLIVVLGIAAQYRHFGRRLDQPLVLLFFATATAYAISAGSVYVVMLLVGPVYGQIFDVRELYVSFSNVRFFGHIQTMLLPFLLVPAMWWGRTRWQRIFLWSVPAIWWMLAVGSGTRGTWCALLVGVIAAWVYGGQVGRRWIKWQLGGLLSGVLCYAVFIWAVPQLLEQPVGFLHRTGDILSLSLREVLWITALDFAVQHPWLGIGPMHYAYFATRVAAHPHNAVLQWLAEWGIPAALLLTAVCAVAGLAFAGHVRRTVAEVGDRQALVLVALLAALAGAAAQAMVDGVLVMPVSQTLLVLLCGWAIGIYFAARTVRSSNMQHVILTAVTVIAAAAVAYGVAPEIGRIAEREKSYLAAHPPDTPLFPRFWTQGWISE